MRPFYEGRGASDFVRFLRNWPCYGELKCMSFEQALKKSTVF